ncbi:unnamed protein product [Boreogadus saida]
MAVLMLSERRHSSSGGILGPAREAECGFSPAGRLGEQLLGAICLTRQRVNAEEGGVILSLASMNGQALVKTLSTPPDCVLRIVALLQLVLQPNATLLD